MDVNHVRVVILVMNLVTILNILSILFKGNNSLPGIPPAKEIISGAVARLIRSRISEERSSATLLENLVIFLILLSVRFFFYRIVIFFLVYTNSLTH